ncbi:rhamnulokinase [Halalkalibacter okhensis]|uniref:Rhamnulokinase n=1 Tax=Halalkalibacter okhensis TaxID=333138 RepID=A0A0B0IK10_9BACI|nr:rhamnulokinase family protein [Halalkalibacter okhensis]KHF41665.1 rhamnulokinase [Halalkalibacter okhensis]
MKKVWAFDLGASNGRLMLSSFDGRYLEIEEIHRFPNKPIQLTDRYYWDILHIFQEMKVGITKSLQKGHTDVVSLAVDTWGVDFGLLSSSGELLSNPYSYRDPLHSEGMEGILEKITREELYSRSGIEPSSINTICQLYGMKIRRPDLIEQADTLLFTPNLINYFFSGVKANEFTISTTSQLYHFKNKNWDFELLEKLNIPAKMFNEITKPGTILGSTLESINKELRMNPVKVINVAGHDTASALAALPMDNPNAAFMSCGTWVLMGVKVQEPIASNQALSWGFTNEGTIDQEYRLQKNNMGLWLMQQCKTVWERDGDSLSYEEESVLIKKARPFTSFINPDDPTFLHPKNMPAQIQEYCRRTGQKPPETKGEILRCILESLTLKYRWVLEKLEHLTGTSIEEINMGGGGIQNQILCQFTANATKKKVQAGPIEASAIGNSLGQLLALGEIANIQEAREIVRRSFSTKVYEPKDQLTWDQAYERFLQNVN